MVGPSGDPRNPTLRCIVDGKRRDVLAALLTWGPRLTERKLAAYVAAKERRSTAPDDAVTVPNRTVLAHDHLPALEAAGLVSWNRDGGTAELAAHPALEDPRFERLLEATSEGLDEVLSAISHEYRRIVLTDLEVERTPMGLTELGRRIRRREAGAAGLDPAAVEETAVSLHHVHLPTLDDLDLVEYDADAGRVTYSGHSALKDVFAIIYEPDERTVDKLDGLFDGLRESYRRASRDRSDRLDWPHFWKEPYHG